MNRSQLMLYAALAVSALCALGVTLIAYRGLPSDSYAQFSVFWGWLFFVVGALAGFQQEIARATRPVDESSDSPSQSGWPRLGLLYAATAPAAVIVTLASGALHPAQLASLIALAIGFAGNIAVALICGALYGTHRWGALAAMVGIDGLLRLVLAVGAVWLGWGINGLEFAAVIPYVVAPIGFGLFARRGGLRFGFDVTVGTMLRNSLNLVLAAAATALLMSGFMVLLDLAKTELTASEFSQVALTITVARAPLVVAVMAVQSLLIVRLRSRARAAQRRLLRAIAWAIVAGGLIEYAILIMAAAPLMAFAKPGQPNLLPLGLYLAVSFSAVGLALMFSVGSALIARGQHAAYLGSWLVTLAVTMVILALGISTWMKVGLALAAPAYVGLIVQLMAGARYPSASMAGRTIEEGSR